ncbi:hypothetical protein PTKIN_Ptkin09bG0033800 [Pterospermum kingtungense]
MANIEKEGEVDDEGYQRTHQKLDEMLPTLTNAQGWNGANQIFRYQGFWLPSLFILGKMLIHDHFKPRPTDIILSTSPKRGTTWLRALDKSNEVDPVHSLKGFRRLGFFHPTFLTLCVRSLTSEDASGCRFVYICRDPKDVLVSKWHFMNRLRSKQVPPLSLEEAFDLFCKGVSQFGPYWDHVLGYWEASVESPNKEVFLKYEDVNKEPLAYVRKLAEFLGVPFSSEEENNGIVQEIVDLCSFESLSNLDVNKTADPLITSLRINNSFFFRKGKVGDWVNYLTPEMGDTLDQITKAKFQGTGFTFH